MAAGAVALLLSVGSCGEPEPGYNSDDLFELGEKIAFVDHYNGTLRFYSATDWPEHVKGTAHLIREYLKDKGIQLVVYGAEDAGPTQKEYAFLRGYTNAMKRLHPELAKLLKRQRAEEKLKNLPKDARAGNP